VLLEELSSLFCWLLLSAAAGIEYVTVVKVFAIVSSPAFRGSFAVLRKKIFMSIQ